MVFKNYGEALSQSPPTLFSDERWRGQSVAFSPAIKVLRGHRAVAGMRDLLVGLSLRTGQEGAMDALEMFLGAPSAQKKTPYLLLIGLRENVEPETATAADLAGAVLIYEYRIAGRGTGIFATDDVDGDRNVIAPADLRTGVAEIACRRLMEMGAIAALISLEGGTDTLERRPAVEASRSLRMATRRRMLPRYLPLADTLTATLATLGDNTRRNFRRYRRRLERDFGAEFVPRVEMDREQFLQMNRASTNPVTEAIAAWRYDSLAHAAQPVLCGLRAADGRWLSLLGGRRRSKALVIDWQYNVAGMPRYSLSTVMRAFLLEYEVAQGTEKLVFVGGTQHPMRHSFVSVSVMDVVVQKRCVTAWLLRKLSRWILPEMNFLGLALRDEHLKWTEP